MTTTPRARPAPIAHSGTVVRIALLLRLLWAWAVPVEPTSDSVLYEAFARSMAAGHGYAYPDGKLTAYWPVGASAVYAVFFTIFGSAGRAAIVAFQALEGAAIVLLTWRLALRTLGPRAATAAAWIVAVWPLLIQFTTIFASELHFTLLLLAALNVWTARSLRPLPRAVLWGLALAGATYMRPIAWPLLIVFPIGAVLVDRRAPSVAVTTLVVSSLVAALAWSPWTYRNFQLFDRFVLVAANGGPNLWMGNNPQSSGAYMPLPERPFADEVARDRELSREAVDFIRRNPAAYLRLCARRLVTTFDRESIGIVWNLPALEQRYGARAAFVAKALSSVFWWVVLVAALAGVVPVVRRWRLTWPVLVPLAYVGLVPVLSVAQDRYHVPLDPLLAMLAATFLASLRRPTGAAASPTPVVEPA